MIMAAVIVPGVIMCMRVIVVMVMRHDSKNRSR
jgi:hypothetical protein